MSVVPGEGSIDDSGTKTFSTQTMRNIYYESNNDEEDSGEDAEATCEKNARSKLHKKIFPGRGHQKLGDKSLMKLMGRKK